MNELHTYGFHYLLEFETLNDFLENINIKKVMKDKNFIRFSIWINRHNTINLILESKNKKYYPYGYWFFGYLKEDIPDIPRFFYDGYEHPPLLQKENL